jgi:hypothetical protein
MSRRLGLAVGLVTVFAITLWSGNYMPVIFYMCYIGIVKLDNIEYELEELRRRAQP